MKLNWIFDKEIKTKFKQREFGLSVNQADTIIKQVFMIGNGTTLCFSVFVIY